MESKTFKVPAIGCNGCVNTITSELNTLAGVKSVQADVNTKQVIVQWEAPATWDSIEARLTELEYPPEAAPVA